MNERCKHVKEDGFNCGSYAFNLYKDGIDQGDLCDVHYWQAKAQRTEQEPVAWIHNFIEGGISIGKRPADLDRYPDRWTALYKEPKPCSTCQALARTVMLDQTSHDTHPPQRTEQNFCSRCGKRTKDLTNIHTCTPPQD